jgi:hypothetical protein
MAITFPTYEPKVLQNAPYRAVDVGAFGITGGQTYTRGQFVVLTSGLLTVCASNAATITGLALSDAQAVYQNVAGQPVASQLFGTGSNLGTLNAGDPAFNLIADAHGGQQFEMSLVQAWATATAGAAFGLTLTSGIFLADTGATAIGRIIGLSQIPQNIPGLGAENNYQVGDIGARVIVEFNAAAVIP